MIDATPRVRGLARNPAAPLDVLLRLLDVAPKEAAAGLRLRGELPLPVQEAMLRHPSLPVRRVLAEHPAIGAEARGRLLADSEWRLAVLAFGRHGRPPLSGDMLFRLLSRIEDDPGELYTSDELLGELTFAAPHYLVAAAAHPDPRVRRRVAGGASWFDESSRAALLTDPEPEVRAVAAAAVAKEWRVMQPADLPERHCHGTWAVLQRPLSRALVDRVVAGDDVSELFFVGPNPSTPPDVVATLLGHPDPTVRRRLAGRADLTGEQLLRLAADPEPAVRTAVSVHPGLTEEQRAAIAIDVTTVAGHGHGHYGPGRLCHEPGHHLHHRAHERVPALADALRWARSVNPLLRRRAARNPGLPAELVAALAGDPDPGVRVLLAHHHPDAPPELLLRTFLECRGCGRDGLRERPRFPVEGLAGHAGDPDPAVRALVALDPHAAGELVDRLCADPEPAVRRAMAACPCLPVARIVALLDHPELAEPAAANPALPADRMARIARLPAP